MAAIVAPAQNRTYDPSNSFDRSILEISKNSMQGRARWNTTQSAVLQNSFVKMRALPSIYPMTMIRNTGMVVFKLNNKSEPMSLSRFFGLLQRAHGVQHGQDHYADVREYREPHTGQSQRSEQQAQPLHAQSKYNIFADNAQGL